MKFKIGDTVTLIEPEKIPDWEDLSDIARKMYLEMLGSKLIIDETMGPDKYHFENHGGLWVSERALIPICHKEVSESEFYQMFV